MASRGMRVGELAKRTGVSVRTLHYYDEIDLLSPSRRSASGHRLYDAAEVARLPQIRSLIRLGLALDEIGRCLTQPEYSLERVLTLQLARLREQTALQEKLCMRLEALVGALRTSGEATLEALVETMEVMDMVERYYTPEQLQALADRRGLLGEDRIKQVEGEWPRLMREVHGIETAPARELMEYVGKALAAGRQTS